MSSARKIYLAGPEVFLPNAIEVLNSMKKICEKYNFVGMSPMDADLSIAKGKELLPMEIADLIFINNTRFIEECEYVVANCSSFRGPLVDDGTSWEIGYAFGLRKVIFGYLPEKLTLVDNVINRIETKIHSSGHPIDSDGYLVNENFGNSINLMLEFSILSSGGSLVVGDFEKCMKNVFLFDQKYNFDE